MDSNSSYLKDGNLSIENFSHSANNRPELSLGPTPHAILSTSAIVEQRLRKRIRKLIQQRDYWKTEYEKLKHILTLFPYTTAPRSYEESQRRAEKLQRLAEYDKMVPLLIKKNEELSKEIEKLKEVTT